MFDSIKKRDGRIIEQERRPQMEKGNQNRHNSYFLIASQG